MELANQVRQRLFTLQDLSYQEFHSKLMPTVSKDRVIGVRTPVLRSYAKELFGSGEGLEYLKNLPHGYYDENNLHGFILCLQKDYGQTLAAVNAFLPYIDNWATCDLLSPKVFGKHLPALLPEIAAWLQSDHTYTIRFGIKMLMDFYLDEAFDRKYADMVAAVKSQEYYVSMMIAWYFATALAKQWDATLPYIEAKQLDKWAHNKAIQKAIESYRITDQQKAYLRTLKVKLDKGKTSG